jgi:hypothetical protein
MITVRQLAMLTVHPMLMIMMRLTARAGRLVGRMPMPMIVVARCHAL